MRESQTVREKARQSVILDNQRESKIQPLREKVGRLEISQTAKEKVTQ